MRPRTPRWAPILLGLLIVVGALGAVSYLNRSHGSPGSEDPTGEGFPRDGPQMPLDTSERMDASHRERVEAFPAKTEGLGGQPLPFRLAEDGAKEFELTAEAVQWEVEPGVFREAWGYNGVVPGPEIRAQEGDLVRVTLHNRLPESTTIHFHGQRIRNASDGVPFVTNPQIRPGESYTYEFVADPPGSHMYHSHYNAAAQVGRGLLGPLIVEPLEPRLPPYDKEVTLVVGDGPLGFTINGKSFPATQPIELQMGEVLRIRWMNEGAIAHPMHIHGLVYQVVARDGWPLPEPFLADTILVAPGERWDTFVVADNPGQWLIHCHILPHAEGEHGMYGMATILTVHPDDAGAEASQ